MAKDKFARFTKAGPDCKQRIIANSLGEVGTGKTRFWLTAPGPIVIQSMDMGLEGVVEPYTESKDIFVASYDIGQTIGESFTHAKAVEAAEKFVEDFEAAIASARTIVWDRETDVFNLFQFAEFGTDDAYGAAPPKDWDKLKGKIRRMIAMAKSCDVNFGLIQGMRNEWGQKVNKKSGVSQPTQTGNRIAAGMDDIDALVHINLFHSRVKSPEGTDFMVTVGKSRGPGAGDVQDQTFANIDFPTLAAMVFPDSDEDAWT